MIAYIAPGKYRVEIEGPSISREITVAAVQAYLLRWGWTSDGHGWFSGHGHRVQVAGDGLEQTIRRLAQIEKCHPSAMLVALSQ